MAYVPVTSTPSKRVYCRGGVAVTAQHASIRVDAPSSSEGNLKHFNLIMEDITNAVLPAIANTWKMLLVSKFTLASSYMAISNKWIW